MQTVNHRTQVMSASSVAGMQSAFKKELIHSIRNKENSRTILLLSIYPRLCEWKLGKDFLIHYFCRTDNKEVFNYLINQKFSSLFWLNAQCKTPLDLALEYNSTGILELFLQNVSFKVSLEQIERLSNNPDFRLKLKKVILSNQDKLRVLCVRQKLFLKLS